MKLVISQKSLKSIKVSLDEFADEVEKRLDQVALETSRQIARDAKNLAPVDKGKLRQQIVWYQPIKKEKGFVKHTVAALMPYSAYQEFGTGGYVDVPPGWEDIAIKFKGKGIRQVNLYPQPFMYPAFAKNKDTYYKDAKFVIDYLIKKFNK